MGTTGHTDAELEIIRAASREIPIVRAPNFSVGVNTLFWLTQQAARILKQDTFDIEVTEMHHRHKIDAPSGTARRLLEILNDETGTSYADDIAHGRFGNIGPRKPREIGMHTLRGGDVVGDHTVMFAADGERVELTHKASSRDTFATGESGSATHVGPAGDQFQLNAQGLLGFVMQTTTGGPLRPAFAARCPGKARRLSRLSCRCRALVKVETHTVPPETSAQSEAGAR
jgi:4-hydroxy-tetrahydrodipicolinate reductase